MSFMYISQSLILNVYSIFITCVRVCVLYDVSSSMHKVTTIFPVQSRILALKTKKGRVQNSGNVWISTGPEQNTFFAKLIPFCVP